MRMKAPGVNVVRRKLASGETKTYFYHRSTGARLSGAPGSPEFLTSLADAQNKTRNRQGGTLSGLIRDFENTKQWRRLAESTKKEYRRIFKFWDAKYGTCPYRALEDKAFRADVLKWHDEFSESKPREADNRLTILARVLSWAAKDGPLRVNVLDGFERAYASDRSEIIGCPKTSTPSCRLHLSRCSLQWFSHFTRGSGRRTSCASHGPNMTARRSRFGSARRGGLAGRPRSSVCRVQGLSKLPSTKRRGGPL